MSSFAGSGGAEMGSGAAGQPRGDGASDTAMANAGATSGGDSGCSCKIEAMREPAKSRNATLMEALIGLVLWRRTRGRARWGKMSRTQSGT